MEPTVGSSDGQRSAAGGAAAPSPVAVAPGGPVDVQVAQELRSAAPVVRLVNAFEQPFNNAVATARTCYASRVITPGDVDKDDKARTLRDRIAKETYAAGHHTTIQHPTFQFVLENVSRHFIWSFLHAHPYYNSEQVSQRYVAVKPERVLVPNFEQLGFSSGQALTLQACYETTVRAQMACYQRLVGLLHEPTEQAYFEIFPGRRKKEKESARAVKKKAQEVARYALPVATFAHLYHTISGLTLHRYHRLCAMLDVPQETQLVVQAMVREVQAWDPLFFRRIEDTLPLESTHEYQALKALGGGGGLGVSASAREFRDHFDAQLGEGRLARLVDYKVNAESVMAQSVRTVLGLLPSALSDEDAIALVLSPARNPYLSESLNLTSLGKLSRTLVHAHYTFQKKLSHTADSQDQRHRTTPGSRPILHTHYVGGAPDLVVPGLLAGHQQALDDFMQTMGDTWQAIDTLLDAGVSPQWALYLLPNAFPIRFEESGDLAGLHHKWTTRLCYNAQEEIWRASRDEVQDVRQVHPRIGQYLQPPCGLRKIGEVRPLCPEGPRFCGVPVWKLRLEDYKRTI